MHELNNKGRSVRTLFQTAKRVGNLKTCPIDHTQLRSLVIAAVHVNKRI